MLLLPWGNNIIKLILLAVGAQAGCGILTSVIHVHQSNIIVDAVSCKSKYIFFLQGVILNRAICKMLHRLPTGVRHLTSCLLSNDGDWVVGYRGRTWRERGLDGWVHRSNMECLTFACS